MFDGTGPIVSRSVASLLAAAMLVAGAPPLQGQTATSFRSGIDVVTLTVTVSRRDNRVVSDLEQANFVVLEDGVPQDLVYFSAARSPIALSLLLDTSASMGGRLAFAQTAASEFAARLGNEDVVQVIDFDSRVTVTQDFTNDRTAVEAAIRKAEPGGSTSVYNAVYIALKAFEKLKPIADRPRRHAIVLLSDGDDTSSLVDFDQVLEQVKHSAVAVYAIGLRSAQDRVLRRARADGDFVLKQFAQQSGGRAFFPDRPEDLAGVYAQVADEIGSQYLLGYIPSGRAGRRGWRTLTVRVDRPDSTARTRAGYFAAGK